MNKAPYVPRMKALLSREHVSNNGSIPMMTYPCCFNIVPMCVSVYVSLQSNLKGHVVELVIQIIQPGFRYVFPIFVQLCHMYVHLCTRISPTQYKIFVTLL